SGSFRGGHRHRAQRGGATGTPSTTSATANPWGQTTGGASASIAAGSNGVIFTDVNGRPRPVRVKINLISNAQAAVTPLRGSLNPGDKVIVSSGAPSDTRAPGQNPQRGPGGGGMGGIGRALR